MSRCSLKLKKRIKKYVSQLSKARKQLSLAKILSHHTSPSSVNATLVKITSDVSEAMQLGLLFSFVPGATPK